MLLDHASVHDALDPQTGVLKGRTLINLTSTAAGQARELAGWAKANGIAYLDGGIMATPDMIGTGASSILYSGSARVHQEYQSILELWGEAAYFGEDAVAPSMPLQAQAMTAGDYTTDVQHLNFTKAAADAIHRTSVEQGVNPVMFEHIKNLIDRHVANGHGAESFVRIFESFKNPAE